MTDSRQSETARVRERAMDAMVNEIGREWKEHYTAAWMLALTQLSVLNGGRWLWLSVRKRVRQARDGPVQEKEQRHE